MKLVIGSVTIFLLVLIVFMARDWAAYVAKGEGR